MFREAENINLFNFSLTTLGYFSVALSSIMN